ncbi:hypothetical protein Tco_0332371 [Tanacetum coccineum]
MRAFRIASVSRECQTLSGIPSRSKGGEPRHATYLIVTPVKLRNQVGLIGMYSNAIEWNSKDARMLQTPVYM